MHATDRVSALSEHVADTAGGRVTGIPFGHIRGALFMALHGVAGVPIAFPGCGLRPYPGYELSRAMGWPRKNGRSASASKAWSSAVSP